jgi:triose/dihydroxyacetone kinase / FAD-AMP lyase (cyclizing)
MNLYRTTHVSSAWGYIMSKLTEADVNITLLISCRPGFRTLSPMPSAEDLIKEMLLYLLDPNDKDRAFVKFEQNDEVVVMINNFGGLSNLEVEALTTITTIQLRTCPLSLCFRWC